MNLGTSPWAVRAGGKRKRLTTLTLVFQLHLFGTRSLVPDRELKDELGRYEISLDVAIHMLSCLISYPNYIVPRLYSIFINIRLNYIH